ncbi:MerC domain-containing protein [Salinisphaera sp. T31B1]|uniref:MerC domain-containing protein n=1 Tax=Salinisphaera sp. T31B1 TaxID=727963 RepID=UPI00333E6258
MRSDSFSDFTGKLDKTAVALSGLCLVHCLLLPFAIALFPVLGFSLVSHETFHQLILILVVPTTAVALGLGWARHRSRTVALLGVIGIAALIAAAFIVHEYGGERLERAITVAGGLVLAAAHIRNFRLSRRLHRHAHHRPPGVAVEPDDQCGIDR